MAAIGGRIGVEFSPMTEDVSPPTATTVSPPTAPTARAAAAAATLSVALAVAVSAPSLTRPFLPGLLFVGGLPFVLALMLGWVLVRLPGLRQAPLAATIAAALVTALPWLLVAGSPMAGLQMMMWLGFLLVLLLPAWFLRRPQLAPATLALAAVLCLLPQGKLALGGGELNPVLVVGMDSGNWRFVDEMIAAHPQDLPHLQELMRRGARGHLMSNAPTASARIWTILATGVNHDLNGIKNFGNNRSDLTAGRIWDHVINPRPDGDPIGSAGLVAWLINTPPDKRDGLLFNTPGWVTGSTLAKPLAASPAKVLERLGEEGARPSFGELIQSMLSSMAVASADHAWAHLDTVADIVFGKLIRGYDKEDLVWRMKIMRDRVNADLYLELARRHGPDFNALVLYGTDQLGHFYWKYHEAKYGKRELFPSVTDREITLRGEACREAYRACDRVLGKLLDRVDLGQATLVLCSDHGMQPLEESRDDLQIKLRAGALLTLADLAVEDFTFSNLNRALYLTPKAGGEEGRRLLDQLRQKVERVKVADSGALLFSTGFPANAPNSIRVDLVQTTRDSLTLESELRMDEKVGSVRDLFTLETRSGRHDDYGFFLMAGPGIRAGAWLEDVDVFDLAPTVTYLMGKAVPADLPGRVVLEAFTPEYTAAHPLRTVAGGFPKPPDVKGVTEADMLKTSGYVDD